MSFENRLESIDFIFLFDFKMEFKRRQAKFEQRDKIRDIINYSPFFMTN